MLYKSCSEKNSNIGWKTPLMWNFISKIAAFNFTETGLQFFKRRVFRTPLWLSVTANQKQKKKKEKEIKNFSSNKRKKQQHQRKKEKRYTKKWNWKCALTHCCQKDNLDPVLNKGCFDPSRYLWTLRVYLTSHWPEIFTSHRGVELSTTNHFGIISLSGYWRHYEIRQNTPKPPKNKKIAG